MDFTVHNNPAIDLQIEKYLNKLGQDISKLLPIRALILYGAFGRGEGRLVINDSNIRIINDLDVMAVIDSGTKTICWDWRDIQSKIQDCSSVFVDIKYIFYDELHRLKLTMDNFDLRNGGYVFMGDKSILDRIPSYDGSLIPKIQGRRLLFNRLITFLEARGGLSEYSLEGERATFCNYQCSKVVMACLDAHLILRGRCVTRYQNKLSHFKDINSNLEHLRLGKKALEIKIGPNNISSTGAIKFWNQTGNFFLQTIQKFFNGEKEFSRVLSGKKLLKNIYRTRGSNFLKYWLKCLLKTERTPRQYLETVELLMLYMLFGAENYTSDINKWLVEYGKCFNIPIESESLKAIRTVYPLVLKLWYDKYHMGIPTYKLWKRDNWIKT